MIRANRISLLSSVTRTSNNGNSNNGTNNNGNNNSNDNNTNNNTNNNNNNNNRNIITYLLLFLFGVLVTSLFVLLVFYEANHPTGLLASLLDVSCIL
jgi:ATP-dependent Zn protease